MVIDHDYWHTTDNIVNGYRSRLQQIAYMWFRGDTCGLGEWGRW